jgi:hypothetical protein
MERSLFIKQTQKKDVVFYLQVYNLLTKKDEFKNGDVTCLDFFKNDSLDYCLAGYQNGNIILWDITTTKPITFLMDVFKEKNSVDKPTPIKKCLFFNDALTFIVQSGVKFN